MNKMIATALIYFHYCELRLRFITVFGLRMLNLFAMFSCGTLIVAAFFKKATLTLSKLQTVTLFRHIGFLHCSGDRQVASSLK